MVEIIIEAIRPERACVVDHAARCSGRRIDVHIAEIIIEDVN
jgi:hypothetical protein